MVSVMKEIAEEENNGYVVIKYIFTGQPINLYTALRVVGTLLKKEKQILKGVSCKVNGFLRHYAYSRISSFMY
jgi:hypothetical protein